MAFCRACRAEMLNTAAACYGRRLLQIGQTALHIAGIWNSVEAGEVLLQLGADLDARNDLSGATPLVRCLRLDIHRGRWEEVEGE